MMTRYDMHREKTTTLKKDMKKDCPGLVDIETKWNKLTKIGEVKTYENLRKQTRHDSLKALKDLKAGTAVAWLGGLPNRNDLMRHDKSAELHPSEVESPAQKCYVSASPI